MYFTLSLPRSHPIGFRAFAPLPQQDRVRAVRSHSAASRMVAPNVSAHGPSCRCPPRQRPSRWPVRCRRSCRLRGRPAFSSCARSAAEPKDAFGQDCERRLMAGTADDERQLQSIPKIDDGFRAANLPARPSRRDPEQAFGELATSPESGRATSSLPALLSRSGIDACQRAALPSADSSLVDDRYRTCHSCG